MELGIGGKVAMVAAASKGIGFAIARALANEGCKVSLCARNESGLRQAVDAIPGAFGTICDVSDASAIADWHQATSDYFGPPQILVTNTGGPPAGKWTELTDDQWRSGFQSTLLNVVRMVRLASPAMRQAGWGRIVHLTSLVAAQPHALLPISSTLRSGISSLTRLQSDELAPHGVTVNSVLPGHTLTDRQRHLAEVRSERDGISVDKALEETARSVPIGRLADPDEVAAAVAFLCSAQASYITGVNLLVDGGLVRAPG